MHYIELSINGKHAQHGYSVLNTQLRPIYATDDLFTRHQLRFDYQKMRTTFSFLTFFGYGRRFDRAFSAKVTFSFSPLKYSL